MVQAVIQSEGIPIETPPTKMSVLSKEALIPVGLVVTLASAIFSFGIMYQRVSNLEDQLNQVKSSVNSISSVRDDTIILKEQVRQVGIVVQEVREDVKDLKNQK